MAVLLSATEVGRTGVAFNLITEMANEVGVKLKAYDTLIVGLSQLDESDETIKTTQGLDFKKSTRPSTGS